MKKTIDIHKAELDWKTFKTSGETPKNNEPIFCVTIDSLPIGGVYKILKGGEGIVIIRDDLRWQESYKGWDEIRFWFPAHELLLLKRKGK